jgi:hypothetical protein
MGSLRSLRLIRPRGGARQAVLSSRYLPEYHMGIMSVSPEVLIGEVDVVKSVGVLFRWTGRLSAFQVHLIFSRNFHHYSSREGRTSCTCQSINHSPISCVPLCWYSIKIVSDRNIIIYF